MLEKVTKLLCAVAVASGIGITTMYPTNSAAGMYMTKREEQFKFIYGTISRYEDLQKKVLQDKRVYRSAANLGNPLAFQIFADMVLEKGMKIIPKVDNTPGTTGFQSNKEGLVVNKRLVSEHVKCIELTEYGTKGNTKTWLEYGICSNTNWGSTGNDYIRIVNHAPHRKQSPKIFLHELPYSKQTELKKRQGNLLTLAFERARNLHTIIETSNKAYDTLVATMDSKLEDYKKEIKRIGSQVRFPLTINTKKLHHKANEVGVIGSFEDGSNQYFVRSYSIIKNERCNGKPHGKLILDQKTKMGSFRFTYKIGAKGAKISHVVMKESFPEPVEFGTNPKAKKFYLSPEIIEPINNNISSQIDSVTGLIEIICDEAIQMKQDKMTEYIQMLDIALQAKPRIPAKVVEKSPLKM